MPVEQVLTHAFMREYLERFIREVPDFGKRPTLSQSRLDKVIEACVEGGEIKLGFAIWMVMALRSAGAEGLAIKVLFENPRIADVISLASDVREALGREDVF